MAGSSSRHHNNNKKEQAMQNKLLLEPRRPSANGAHITTHCAEEHSQSPPPPGTENDIACNNNYNSLPTSCTNIRLRIRQFESRRRRKINAVCARMYMAEHLCVCLSKFTSVCGRKRREGVCVCVFLCKTPPLTFCLKLSPKPHVLKESLTHSHSDTN